VECRPSLVIEHLDIVEQGLLRVGVALEAGRLSSLFTVENQLSITALS
jgi:hypothetical protein